MAQIGPNLTVVKLARAHLWFTAPHRFLAGFLDRHPGSSAGKELHHCIELRKQEYRGGTAAPFFWPAGIDLRQGADVRIVIDL